MATVKPFKAIRPDAKYADKVISLPYDVMNRKEAAEMAADNPYSFLHICRAEIDLPDQENAYDQSLHLPSDHGWTCTDRDRRMCGSRRISEQHDQKA